MTDVEHKRKLVTQLEAGNQRTYNELQEKIPRFGMDTSDLRRELFIDHLVQWGVITEEQKLDFDIAFHREIEDALKGAWQQYRESQQKLSVVTKPSSLIDQHGRPLK